MTMPFELDKLSKWFQPTKLSLNVYKTNFMIFSNKTCFDNCKISISGMDITIVCYKVSRCRFRLPIKLE